MIFLVPFLFDIVRHAILNPLPSSFPFLSFLQFFLFTPSSRIDSCGIDETKFEDLVNNDVERCDASSRAGEFVEASEELRLTESESRMPWCERGRIARDDELEQ